MQHGRTINGKENQSTSETLTTENEKAEQYVLNGEAHYYNGKPLLISPEALQATDEEKIAVIAEHFKAIMETLGLDLTDDSLEGTPFRVAKMYVQELFSGLNPKNAPNITLFENKFGYKEMLVEKNISVKTMCEHHFVPIVGVAHVGYISSGKVIGLSKINRIVEYYCKRPQIQERLTTDIAQKLSQALDTPDVAVVIDAKHYCVALRGVEDDHSSTVTATYKGRFEDPTVRNNFLTYVSALKPY